MEFYQNKKKSMWPAVQYSTVRIIMENVHKLQDTNVFILFV